jgi:hypothetical protein
LGLTVSAVKKRVFRGKQQLFGYLRQAVQIYAGSAEELADEVAFIDAQLRVRGL